ncbi:MAG: hypothetical protein RIQ89_2294, partial [Bacteroidota bacterium]
MYNLLMNLISVVILIMATEISDAQSYTLDPNDTISMNGQLDDLSTLSIQQNNNTNGIIQLSWQKIYESLPANWTAAVCDNSACYTYLVNSGNMNPINPNEYGLLLLHITPHVNYGSAIVQYAVWDVASPNIIDTLTYSLTVNQPTDLIHNSFNDAINFYPNPSSDKLTIESGFAESVEYKLVSINGEIIFADQLKPKLNSISLLNIKSGIYFINVLNH